MKVWVANVYTEAADTYIYLFKDKPTVAEITERAWKLEGQIEDLSFYEDTLSIKIFEEEVIE